MIYTNLIYFLIAIFTFSSAPVPETPWPDKNFILLILGLIVFLYSLVAAKMYARTGSSTAYFSTEKKLSILAVFIFVFCAYALDIKYYFHIFSFDGALPSLENSMGLGFFFLLLSTMWFKARPFYEKFFTRRYSPLGFLTSNIKTNLPIILPWMALSFLYDFLLLLPIAGLKNVLNSPWGDVVLFGFFLIFLITIFPPLVRYLWDCKPLPAGNARMDMEKFCRRQNFSVELLLWPLYEGRILTAAILGFIKGFRYLLVTQGLLDALTPAELEAVVAHEIGHVRKKHLFLYLLLFLGFSVLTGFMVEPFHYLILNTSLFYALLKWFNTSPDAIIALLGGIPLLILMIIYFRFIFGYFIRNFERQADLHIFQAIGHSAPLVSAFEKIAILSGNIRDKKSWHHFGIGERIDYLLHCERDPSRIRRQDHKVFFSMALYFIVLASSIIGLKQIPIDNLISGYEEKYMTVVLQQKIENEPTNALWYQLLGDLMQDRGLDDKALKAYEETLELTPSNANIMNNIAWLLVTTKNQQLRDPHRALSLALTAVSIKEESFIFDTLATVYWANGKQEKAVNTELLAIQIDPSNAKFYQAQIEKFKSKLY